MSFNDCVFCLQMGVTRVVVLKLIIRLLDDDQWFGRNRGTMFVHHNCYGSSRNRVQRLIDSSALIRGLISGL